MSLIKNYIFLYSFVFLSTSLQAQELRFSAGKDNIVHQVASEVLQRAYNRIGHEPKFIYMDLQKSLELSNSGKTDGEIARIKIINKTYPNLILVPVSLNYVEAMAFTKITSLYVRKWQDLKPYKIGIAKGAKFIETGTAGMNITLYSGFKEAFIGLENDEVDLIVTPKTTGRYILLRQNFKNIKLVGETLQKLDLYHFLHKKNAALIPKLIPILEDMKQRGEIEYIRRYYFRKITK